MSLTDHRTRRRRAFAAGAIVIGATLGAALVLRVTGLHALLADAGVDDLLLLELVAVVVAVASVWTAMLLWTLDLLEQARRDLVDDADLDVIAADHDDARARRRAQRELDRAGRRARAIAAEPDPRHAPPHRDEYALGELVTLDHRRDAAS